MTTNTKFFTSKEQYIAFRKAFAKISRGASPHYYLLLNLIRGLPYHRGFTPKTRRGPVMNGCALNQGLDSACWHLYHIVEAAKKVITPPTVTLAQWMMKGKTSDQILVLTKQQQERDLQHYRTKVDSFLGTLDGTLTTADLARIEVPKVSTITYAHLENADDIIGKHISYEQLLASVKSNSTASGR